jgi:hypothetical protein
MAHCTTILWRADQYRISALNGDSLEEIIRTDGSVLVGFSIKNFRSIAAVQSINFVASADPSHEMTHCVATKFAAVPRLTRTAALFGPNGSGKSNILFALSVMRDFLLRSPAFSPADIASRYMPFMAPETIGAPTGFAVDVIVGRLRYRYKFTYDAQQILSEELRVFISQKSQLWFGREFNSRTRETQWAPFSPSLSGPRERWRRATKPRALFLSTAGQMNAAHLAPLLEWFDSRLDIKRPADFTDVKPLVNRLKDTAFKMEALKVLRSVDVPVADLRIAESKLPSLDLFYNRRGENGAWINLQEDSEGMRHLLHLLVPILDGAQFGRCVAVDEFDTRLHPMIARFLIELIQSDVAAARGMQFLFVSHDMALLDLGLLRRDEVWFVETDKTLASKIRGLASFGPRRREIVAKSYLLGRFGAVPKVRAARLALQAPKARS